jgi:hypothetical protein
MRKRASVTMLICLFLVFGVFAAILQSRTGEAATPQVQVQVPRQARVGQPIEVTLALQGANGIGGYETTIGFDVNRIHLQGLEQRPQDLRKLGRDAQPVGPVEVSNGIVVGAYSCPTGDCKAGRGGKNGGGKGKLRLATVTLVADEPGIATITLSDFTVVDASGQSVEVSLPSGPIQIQVEGE